MFRNPAPRSFIPPYFRPAVLVIAGMLLIVAEVARGQPASANAGKNPPAAAATVTSATVATGPLPGHSLHGEVFNEGPRQRATLMPGLGRVHFPITCSHPEGQPFFDQGIAQFHGFWFFEAERSFRQVALLEPQSAMAYWGMALANLRNRPRAKGFIAEAVKRQEPASAREQLWIKALADYLDVPDSQASGERWTKLVKGLEAVLYEFPDETEANALLAYVLWEASHDGLPINSRQAVDALLAQVFAANPDHPGGHHYMIHLWDKDKPERALRAAAAGGPAAPGIAHLWHMPGHVYDQLHRYRDAAWQQEASSRVDHAYMRDHRVLPFLIHNYAHNQEWLIRSRIHCGQPRRASAIVRNLLEIPHHPQHNGWKEGGGCAQFARERLVDLLVGCERWDDLLRVSETPWFPPTSDLGQQNRWLRARGLAHFAAGHMESGRQQLEALRQRLTEQRREQDSAGKTAEDKARQEQKPEPEIVTARDTARKPFDDLAGRIEASIRDLEALEMLTAGSVAASIEKLRSSGLPKSLIARLFLTHDLKTEAEKIAKEAVDASPGQVFPLAIYVEVLASSGKLEEARKQFETLRPLVAEAELDAEPLARLATLASSWGYPEDWREAVPPAPDLGPRPELDSLGPATWAPWTAESWQVRDAAGNDRSSQQFAERPVLLVCYLGFGCLHCVEQLKALAPLAGELERLGVTPVGIGTDPPAELSAALAQYQKDSGAAFPFLMCADENLAVFKSLGAFDDFEQRPLHATLLIDGQGRVRWQDVSYQPFSDAKYLVDEVRRLLTAPKPTDWPWPEAAQSDPPAVSLRKLR